jgi:hypothetical protein
MEKRRKSDGLYEDLSTIDIILYRDLLDPHGMQPVHMIIIYPYIAVESVLTILTYLCHQHPSKLSSLSQRL